MILENPLLRAGLAGARELLTSGYVQPLMGEHTPIHEWRPVLSLSFLLQRLITGFAPLPFHAVNLLLHILVAILVYEALRRRLGDRPALAGALCFAVLPVHAEVVAYLTSRSELLGAASILGAWILLGLPARPGPVRLAAASLVYLAGGLSKEHVLLFPLFLAISDLAFAGEPPWRAGRRAIHLALGVSTLAVLLGRGLLLPAVAHGGTPYFASVPLLPKSLTLAKFWIWHYLRPAVSGIGLCSDYARPFWPDATPTDPIAWACLLGLSGCSSLAALALLRRRQWGFWLLGPSVFLLPTSHLLIPLDTLGAQRFLYVPSLGLAAAVGTLFLRAESRWPKAARATFLLTLLWLGGRAAQRARDWRDDESYYRAATACNPVSAKARAGLGTALLRDKRPDEGERELLSAQALDPRLHDAAYNLALLALERGNPALARTRLETALAISHDSPDGLILQALLAENEGHWPQADAFLAQAIRIRPLDPTARYNRARTLSRLDRPREASAELKEFLRLAPEDPDAPAAHLWLRDLEGRALRAR